MIIYTGRYLNIHFEKSNDRFIQFWTTSPNTIDSFKEEMLLYTTYYKRYKPSQTLWLHQNFTLCLDDAAFGWVEKYINIPCVTFGNKKTAFVVGKDVMAHLSVIESFESVNSVVKPSHFASEEEARNWLDETPKFLKKCVKPIITYEGIDENGNSIIKVKRASKDITKTIKSFKDLIEENDFVKKNLDVYSSLTKREKEILKLYSTGQKHKEISDELFLSLHTVKTHWRNIKKKLEINSFNDIIKYTKAFDLK